MWVLDSVDTFCVKICSTTKSSRNEVLKTALSHLLLKTSCSTTKSSRNEVLKAALSHLLLKTSFKNSLQFNNNISERIGLVKIIHKIMLCQLGLLLFLTLTKFVCFVSSIFCLYLKEYFPPLFGLVSGAAVRRASKLFNES